MVPLWQGLLACTADVAIENDMKIRDAIIIQRGMEKDNKERTKETVINTQPMKPTPTIVQTGLGMVSKVRKNERGSPYTG